MSETEEQQKQQKAYLNLLKNSNYQKGQFLSQIFAVTRDDRETPEDRLNKIQDLVRLSGVYLDGA